MNITEDQLAAMLPTNKDIAEWCKVLNSALPKYEINNARRIAALSRSAPMRAVISRRWKKT
jgi:hypothetical protein